MGCHFLLQGIFPTQSLVGSLLLSPGSWFAQSFVCALQESVSPVLCKVWPLYCGLMRNSSKRAYAILGLPCPEPMPLQQSTADPYLLRRHPNTVMSQSLWGLWVLKQLMFEPSKHLWWVLGLILKVNLPLLPSCWGLLLCP